MEPAGVDLGPLRAAVACPWDGFTPSEIHFCEERLCAWVTQPANTWSNVGFLVAGAWIGWATRRDPARRLPLFWIAPIVIGLGSLLYHASSTLVGQALDLLGMFLFSAFVLVENARRVGACSRSGVPPLFAAVVAVSMGLMFLDRAAGIVLFALQVTVAGVFEVRIFRRLRPAIDYRPLLLMCGLFVVAFGLWILDITRVLCDPHNHIFGGHAAWHLLNALCLVYAYRFYRQAG